MATAVYDFHLVFWSFWTANVQDQFRFFFCSLFTIAMVAIGEFFFFFPFPLYQMWKRHFPISWIQKEKKF